MHERNKAQNAFSLKYGDHLDPHAHLWERCAEVLSRRDMMKILRKPW